jgi:peptidoglycan/LPS O-acetylase OafA/YrhL
VDSGRRRGSAERLDVAAEMRLRKFAALFQVVSRTGLLAVVPGPTKAGSSDHWSNIGSVVVQSALGHQPPPPVAFFAGMSSAFAQGKPDAFNSQVAQYRQWLAANGLAPEARKAGFEALSNLLLPLVRAVVLYAVALVLVAVARRRSSATGYRSALMMVLLASALHGTGLLFATMLAGRPSWIALSGWAIGLTALVVTLVVKRFRRSGHGTLASAAIGLTALVAAYAVTPGGAASLLRNVLDTSLVVAIGATVFVLSVGRESRTARRSVTASQAALESPIA